MKALFHRWQFNVAIVIIALVTIFCTQLPLLNYLGFEFGAVLAVVGGLVAGLLGTSLYQEQLRREVSGGGFLRNYVQTVLKADVFMLVVPLLIMLLNAFCVKNCSLTAGFVLYILLPVPAFIFSSSLAFLIVSIVRKWSKMIYIMCYVLILLHIAYVTVSRPQIFAFNPIIGFFPGMTYDEGLQVVDRLLWYRMTTLLVSAAFVIIGVMMFRIQEMTGGSFVQKTFRASSRYEKVVLTTISILLAVVYVQSDRIGFSSSEQSIARELGGVYHTEHFVIYYPITESNTKRIKALAQLHEFYLDKLQSEFRIFPTRKFTSFLYESAEQKGRLIGAAVTNISKPWLRQMHINIGEVERLLKHEMVHCVAAEFGIPMLGVSWSPGIVEGAAVASEQIQIDEPLHTAAAMIVKLYPKLRMETFFTLSGFWSAQSGLAYTLSGSFCRYLIDVYGVENFKELYMTGDVERIYGKELSALIADWRSMVESTKLDSSAIKKGAFYFQRPSIFSKECPRVIANLNAEGWKLYQQQRYDDALTIARQANSLSKSPESIGLLARSLFALKRLDSLQLFIEEQFKDTTLGVSLLSLKLMLGDSYVLTGNIKRAEREYTTYANVRLSLASIEAAAVRIELLKRHKTLNVLKSYIDPALTVEQRQRELSRHSKVSPVVLFLLGRDYISADRLDEGAAMLQQIKKMSTTKLDFIRLRRLGICYYRLENYEQAKEYFRRAIGTTGDRVRLFELLEWIERSEWMQKGR